MTIDKILDRIINKHLHYNAKLKTILITDLETMKKEIKREIIKLIKSVKIKTLFEIPGETVMSDKGQIIKALGGE